MICHDLLGIFQAFTPKFVKRYADIGLQMESAFASYASEVREGRFPTSEHSYRMLEGEAEKLMTAVEPSK